MSTRAKFKVQSVTKHSGWNGDKYHYTVDLTPVTGNSDENKRFFAATPGGSIKLTVVNAEVGDQFDIGQEFYVDFTPAEAA